MDFSESWKATWPVSAVFPAPNLLSGPAAHPLGPLLFSPSSSPPLPLFSSPSLARPPPPINPSSSSSIRDGLRTFFRDANEGFVPSSVQADLLAAVLPDPGGTRQEEGLSSGVNQLHVLRCRDGATFVLFFPTGSNSDEVGYLGLSLKGSGEPAVTGEGGDVFKQKEGFVHTRHRITGMSAVPMDPPGVNWEAPVNPQAEGYLLVTTVYSVCWFRVEIRVSMVGSGQGRPFLVPVGRRSFTPRVVHACWNPHFKEECSVLLENGDLYWVMLGSKRGVRVKAPEGDYGRWLSCQFGGLPWILFVASSNSIVTVDLRSKNGSKRTVLAVVEEPSSYMIVHSMEKDVFIAFCKANFDDFHFCVLTEHHLLLFDTRQPLVPVLKWDHRLQRPGYIAMYRLSELRPSKVFKWASESGFAILVGSFWNSEFSLFCFGPKMKGDSHSLTLYAWELPSDLCLLGGRGNSVDDVLKRDFSKDKLPGGTEWWQREVVVGFFILPEASFSVLSESEDTGGFILWRILSSGKLEWQRYCSSWRPPPSGQSCKLETLTKIQDCQLLLWDQKHRLATRHDFLKLNFLSAYLSGNLSKVLISEMHNVGLGHTESKQFYDNPKLMEGIKELNKSPPNVSDCLRDVSIPMSIYEIASQRALSSLPSNLLHLAFSRYSELFTDPRDSSFEFLEVCNSVPHKQLPSFLTMKPSGRSEKWSHKVLPTDSIVGPVLPLPVLLTLQQIEDKDLAIWPDEISNGDDLLSCQCRMILEGVFPEISIAGDNACNEYFPSQDLQDERPFFIHEPRACAGVNHIYKKTCSAMVQQKEGDTVPHSESSETTIKEDRFSIFISGIRDRPDHKSFIQNMETLEMFDDLTPVRLDIDSSISGFSQNEHKIYNCLKRQFAKWLEGCQDSHDSSKIPKRTP
uniref:Rootletin n=1 Tax=Anthurium amnicola TaxID=1678845 RepID=A0A1D1YAX2_9ARAE